MADLDTLSMKDVISNRKGGRIRISEIYSSRQGEGLLTGTPSTFVRTSGCNLRCWFCDTPFASWNPEGDNYDVAQIIALTQPFNNRHIVLTGGEPMIFKPIVSLCEELSFSGHHLTIETSGTVYRKLRCDLMSISPKLSRSGPEHGASAMQRQATPYWQLAHEHRRRSKHIVEQLIQEYQYQLKFVVDDMQDAEEVLCYINGLDNCDRDRVLIMPQGTDVPSLKEKEQWLVRWCEENQLRYCPRKHIEWFGNRRGT